MMTDEERSRALIDRWAKLFSDELADQETITELAGEFKQARLGERRAITAFLQVKADGQRLAGDADLASWVERLAGTIDRGYYES